MNEKTGKRLPKHDRKKIEIKRLSKSDKRAIATEYDKRLKKEKREDILDDLASKRGKSKRTIEAYISKGRQIIAERKHVAEFKRIQRDLSKEQVKKHFDELGGVAKTLYDVQRLIGSYETGETYSVFELGGIIGFFAFQPLPKKNINFSVFSGNNVAVDYPEIKYFFDHLLQEFPKLRLNDWKELIINKAPLPQDVIERIRYLGNTARFTSCPNCQVCKDLMASKQT